MWRCGAPWEGGRATWWHCFFPYLQGLWGLSSAWQVPWLSMAQHGKHFICWTISLAILQNTFYLIISACVCMTCAVFLSGNLNCFSSKVKLHKCRADNGDLLLVTNISWKQTHCPLVSTVSLVLLQSMQFRLLHVSTSKSLLDLWYWFHSTGTDPILLGQWNSHPLKIKDLGKPTWPHLCCRYSALLSQGPSWRYGDAPGEEQQQYR